MSRFTFFFSLFMLSLLCFENVYATVNINYAWDTGDVNSRASYPIAAYDRDQSGASDHYLAPIQHGVQSFDREGNFEWSYAGITDGYDVRDITVGDLQETGYNDTIVVASGYYNNDDDGRVAILDKDGAELQLITASSVAAIAYSVAIDGTDVYIGSGGIVSKFVKSGSVWIEDTVNWPQGPGTGNTKKNCNSRSR